MFDDFMEALERVALGLAVLVALAASPFVVARAVEVMSGQDDEPRVDAAYWAERGYDTTNNSLPPVTDGQNDF